LVFHDQGLLLPFLEQQLGPPRPKLQPRPPAAPPPRHLVEAQKAELEEKEQTLGRKSGETWGNFGILRKKWCKMMETRGFHCKIW
jgi:hypothetical protein